LEKLFTMRAKPFFFLLEMLIEQNFTDLEIDSIESVKFSFCLLVEILLLLIFGLSILNNLHLSVLISGDLRNFPLYKILDKKHSGKS